MPKDQKKQNRAKVQLLHECKFEIMSDIYSANHNTILFQQSVKKFLEVFGFPQEKLGKNSFISMIVEIIFFGRNYTITVKCESHFKHAIHLVLVMKLFCKFTFVLNVQMQSFIKEYHVQKFYYLCSRFSTIINIPELLYHFQLC